MSKNKDTTLLKGMLAGGLASCFAEFCTMPMDTVKVRIQNFQNIYKGMTNTFRKIYLEEGFFAFYKGLGAGLMRQIIYASLRLGLYDYSLSQMEKRGVQTNILHQIAVGLLSGGFAIAVANPLDVLLVKFQSDVVPIFKEGKVVELRKNYRNLRHAVLEIPRKEGWRSGYYLSLWPNVMRHSLGNAIELVTFSQLSYLLR